MLNAQEELLSVLERVGGKIKCAHIYGGPGHYYWDDHNNLAKL